MTMGLIVGAASKKPIAAETGTRCKSKRRATGTLPHSQTGNKNPTKLPIKAADTGFLGINCRKWLSLIYRSKRLDKMTPIKRKGNASTIKLRNRVNPLENCVIMIHYWSLVVCYWLLVIAVLIHL
jgi:hypothetical protein